MSGVTCPGPTTAPPPWALRTAATLPSHCLHCLPVCLQVAGNPCLSYIEHVVLPWCEKFEVERAEANGGNRCATVLVFDPDSIPLSCLLTPKHITTPCLKPGLAAGLALRIRQHPTAPPPTQHCLATTPCCRCYTAFEELVADYESGALHPADLKPALAKQLNQILQPVSAALLGWWQLWRWWCGWMPCACVAISCAALRCASTE